MNLHKIISIRNRIVSALLTWETTTANEVIELPMTDSVTIDWGDGTITNGVTSHTYATAGTYQVKLSGDITTYNNTGGNKPNKDNLHIVERFGGIEVGSQFMWNNTNMDITATDSPTITSLNSAFRQCTNLVGNSSINDWDVSNVTAMGTAFASSPLFNQPLGNWDTSSALTTAKMFEGATNFNQDLTYWDLSNVTTTQEMFEDATNFNGDISEWKLGSLENTFLMFRQSAFNGDVSTKTVTNSKGTYTAWDMSTVTNMNGMFRQCPFNQPLNSWDTSSVNNMSVVFYLNSDFNQDLDQWDTSLVTTLFYTFREATNFNGNITTWNTSLVETLDYCFYFASAFNQDISTKAVTVNGNTYTAWDTSLVTNMTATFNGASDFNQDIGNWNTSSLELANNFLQGCVDFNQDLSTKVVTVNGVTYTAWDMSSVINARAMLRDTISFNQDISSWDTSSMTDIGYLFDDASSFNQDISTNVVTVNGVTYTAWNTSSVTKMDNMFRDADSFNQDISSWDFSSVTTVRSFMANKTSANYDATYYDNLLIKWDNAVGGLVFANMTDVVIGMGTIKYTAAGASARASLVSKGFIITDGGLNDIYILPSGTNAVDLTPSNSDYIVIPQSEKLYQVPSTGTFSLGVDITIPTTNPSATTGLIGYIYKGATQNGRYGMYLGSDGRLYIQFGANNSQNPTNLTTLYGGQRITIHITFTDNSNVKVYIDDTLINQYGYGNPVVSPPLSHMYVGAYGDSNPLNPTSGRYFDGKIHSFFIGDDRFAMEEATGNEIFNQDSTVKATINTSSSTANYIDNMWTLS